MIASLLRKWKLRGFLRRYLDKGAVDPLLAGGHPGFDGASDARTFECRHIDFVIAYVRGENPAQVSERIGQVADQALLLGATVHGLSGALMMVALMVPGQTLPIGSHW